MHFEIETGSECNVQIKTVQSADRIVEPSIYYCLDTRQGTDVIFPMRTVEGGPAGFSRC
jgi:hypothetical protein